MERLRLGMGIALAAALAACGAPVAGPIAPAVPDAAADGQVYPDGNTYRLLATEELPIVAVTADSEQPGLAKARLADGDLATQWGSGGYQAPTAWAAVELAAPARLSGIAIKTGAMPAGTSYDVQVSADGQAWTTVLANQRNTTWNLETRALPAGTTGKLVRIFGRNNPTAPQARFSIFELRVDGEAAGGPSPTPPPASASPTPAPTAMPTATPTAPPSTAPTPAPSSVPDEPPIGPETTAPIDQAIASSTYTSLDPARAVDADTNTQWANGGYREAEATLTVRVNGRFAFRRVDLKTGALPAGVTYQFEVSDDGASWRTASPRLTSTTWGVESKAVDGQGRWLRVRFFNDPAAPVARFQVYHLALSGFPTDYSFPVVTAPGDQYQPTLAWNPAANEYLAVYQDDVGGFENRDVMAQRLDRTGRPLGAAVRLTPQAGQQGGAQVVFNDKAGEYLVAWGASVDSTNSDVHVQRVSAAGQPLGTPLNLTAAAGGHADGPAIAVDGTTGTYLVAWDDSRTTPGDADVWAQRLSSNGTPAGAAFPVATGAGQQTGVQVAANTVSHQFLVAWQDSAGGDFDLYARRVAGDGGVAGDRITLAQKPNQQLALQLAYNSRDDEYLAAWSDWSGDTPDEYGQRLTAGGTKLGGTLPLRLGPGTSEGVKLVYSAYQGAYMMVFDEYGAFRGDAPNWDTFCQIVGPTGDVPYGARPLLTHSGDQNPSGLAYNATANEYFALMLDNRGGGYDVYGRRFPYGTGF